MPLFQRAESRYWWMEYTTADGQRVRKSTRIKHLRDKSEESQSATPAQRTANKVEAELELHKAYTARIAARHDLPAGKPPRVLADHLEWYREHVSAHHKGHAREVSILKRLTKDLGALWLADLTRDRILEWRTARAKQVTAGSVNRELDVLKAVLAAAVPRYLAHSPALGVPRLHHVSAPRQILTRQDEGRLLRVLAPADQAIIIAALDTLARAGDLYRLTWQDDHGAYLTFPDPKTGKSYEVPVSVRLRRALDGLDRSSARIFQHRQSKLNDRPMEFWRMLRDGCLKANIPPVTFHALRHTGASRLVAAGVDLRTVQALGGWASLKQLSRYAHPTHQHLCDAVELIGAAVASDVAHGLTEEGTRDADRAESPSDNSSNHSGKPQNRRKRA